MREYRDRAVIQLGKLLSDEIEEPSTFNGWDDEDIMFYTIELKRLLAQLEIRYRISLAQYRIPRENDL